MEKKASRHWALDGTLRPTSLVSQLKSQTLQNLQKESSIQYLKTVRPPWLSFCCHDKGKDSVTRHLACEELWLGRPLAWRNESSLANIAQRDPRASNRRISQMPAARKCVQWLRIASLCWHEWRGLWSCGLSSVTNSKRTRSTSTCGKSESCTTATDDYPTTRADGFPHGFLTCANHLWWVQDQACVSYFLVGFQDRFTLVELWVSLV